MELERNVGGTDRIVRGLLAAVLAVLAVNAVRNRRYSTLVVTALGAVGLGFNATTCFCGLNRVLGVDTTE